jgi:hypothetical protein
MGLTPTNTAPKSWRPDEGDPNPLVGRLADVTTAANSYGEYPLAEIVDDQGVSWNFHAFRDIAKNELCRLAPETGDVISVHYGGVPDGKKYHVYKVRFADGRSSKFDYKRFADPAAEPVEPSNRGEGDEYLDSLRPDEDE